LLALGLALFVAACGDNSGPTDANVAPDLASKSTNGTQRINVLLKAPATSAQRAELNRYGTIYDEIARINGLMMKTKASEIAAIRALPYVQSVSQDAERDIGPIDLVPANITTFSGIGANTWNLDAINVTDFGAGRTIRLTPGGAIADGSGVYIAVLDTGLLPSWRAYFPDARIATQFAKAFGGGGNDQGNVHDIPNKWEHDVDSHGTHVTSIILGYTFPLGGQLVAFNGTAPNATIIPVKVLNQNGSGWSSVVAAGISYVAGLKAGPLANSPVVINMSLGGPVLDDFEKAAIDDAIAQGVIIVASAGNAGPNGPMGFPGAYAPVISVASAGFAQTLSGTQTVGEWESCLGQSAVFWFFICDVPEPTGVPNLYISAFSSKRTGDDQDLDVAAPGSWVVGPYQVQQGKLSWFFIGGTSQAAPHVSGIVALMLQKNPTLGVAAGARAARAEEILTGAAFALTDEAQVVRPTIGVPAADPNNWTADHFGAGFIRADAALTGTP
jgi:subtilisin family serine protease